MPASIAHMLISKQVRERLAQDPETKAISDVLNKHPEYMELGSQGPDLPYFNWKSLIDPNLPIGVDQWSYQLHSKNPNIFPKQLFEVMWRESDPVKPWEESDNCKFSFLCGFLTHMAADQTIHPMVNSIAGSYYQNKAARKEHKNCEMCQDLYFLAKTHEWNLCRSQYRSFKFDKWCNIRIDKWKTPLFKGVGLTFWDILWRIRRMLNPPPCPIEFVYFLQRSFVEAHSVTPYAFRVEGWIRVLWYIMSNCNRRRDFYKDAYRQIIATDGTVNHDSIAFKRYILLEGVPFKMHDTYDDYLEESIQLAIVYIQAVYELYLAPREDDYIREAFLKVVVNADLGVPLQRHIPESAKENLPILKKVIKERWALAGARAWLKYVDQIEYAESWDNTSENFKIKNDKNDFVTYLTSMRERFGKLKSRELKCVNYITSCPGYSVGEYVNIEFRTSYENNDCALEKIITILDRNRDWKVLDYKIESNTGGTGP